MRSQQTIAMAGTLFLAVTALAGCLSASGSPTSVFVKDAPSDQVKHLYVSFTSVEVHQSLNKSQKESHKEDGSFDEGSEAEEDHGEHDASDREDGKWITILERNVTVDLKAFTGNASAFLDSATIPVGNYNGIRIHVSGATAELENGTVVPVKVPSSKIRIKGHFSVVEGKDTDLTMDFDLAKSLKQEGNGKLILKPYIRLASAHHDHVGDKERHERERRRDEHSEQAREHAKRGK